MNTARIVTIVSILVLGLLHPVFVPLDSLDAKLTLVSQAGASVERLASLSLATNGVEKQNAFPISPTWSTFFGGTGATYGNSMLIDANGNMWTAFDTTAADMPTTTDAIDRTHNGDRDMMVAKFSPDGELLYSTYLGGSATDGVIEITQDNAGFIYLAGYSFSPEFVTTANALDRDLSGERDGVIVKLDSNGQLVYSTFLGGESWDYARRLLVVGDDIYVGGFTHGMFPTTPGVAQPEFGGYGDGFLAKLHTTPTSTTLVFATYLGGNSWDGINGIALDDAGNIYTTGGAQSIDFPTTPGALDRICDNCVTNYKTDGFITKFSPDASQFLYSTFVGSNTATFGSLGFGNILVNESGEATAVGSVSYAGIPITPDAYQPNYSGENDLVIVKINTTGSAVLYGTYFGGGGDDISYQGTALDSHGNLYLTGGTSSTDFPTLNPIQATLGGGYDAFLAVFGPDNHLSFSTFWGGSQDEGSLQSTCANLAIDSQDNPYLIGSTLSPDFPTTSNAFDSTLNGADHNGFVTKFTVANKIYLPIIFSSILPQTWYVTYQWFGYYWGWLGCQPICDDPAWDRCGG